VRLNLYLKIFKRRFLSFSHVKWWFRGFAPPSPQFIKLRILSRNCVPGAAWIETGTYLGETTKFLSKHSKMVFSIEPADILHKFVTKRLGRLNNVQIIFGTSEDVFESTIVKLEKEANFWLDGHASGDITFSNQEVTPIVHELGILTKHIPRFERCAIFIDDVRGFADKTGTGKYPTKEFLVEWANENNCDWSIEHDIFIARKIKVDARD
jgi:hypothetical protein